MHLLEEPDIDTLLGIEDKCMKESKIEDLGAIQTRNLRIARHVLYHCAAAAAAPILDKS